MEVEKQSVDISAGGQLAQQIREELDEALAVNDLFCRPLALATPHATSQPRLLTKFCARIIQQAQEV